MPIKLNDESKANKAERFFKKDVRDMVKEYRKDHPSKKDLKYTHFTVKEILQLFIDNKIVDPNQTINQQTSNLDNHGVKLYLGKHFKPETCRQRGRYLTHSNIIICNTKIVDKDKFYFKDMLDDKDDKHSFTMAGENDGLDMGHICPPDCAIPQTTEYDVAYQKK